MDHQRLTCDREREWARVRIGTFLSPEAARTACDIILRRGTHPEAVETALVSIVRRGGVRAAAGALGTNRSDHASERSIGQVGAVLADEIPADPGTREYDRIRGLVPDAIKTVR